jgi:hypothetical protein
VQVSDLTRTGESVSGCQYRSEIPQVRNKSEL